MKSQGKIIAQVSGNLSAFKQTTTTKAGDMCEMYKKQKKQRVNPFHKHRDEGTHKSPLGYAFLEHEHK